MSIDENKLSVEFGRIHALAETVQGELQSVAKGRVELLIALLTVDLRRLKSMIDNDDSELTETEGAS